MSNDTPKPQALGTLEGRAPVPSSSDATRSLGAVNPLSVLLADPEKLAALPVDNLERLLAMQERMEAETARRSYFDALASFQAECPAVEKRAVIPDNAGNAKYRYAPLEAIVKQVAVTLRVHGFSYLFETEHQPGGVLVSCVSHHRDGHTERASVLIPGITVPKANAAQNAGAGVTYGKRLSFLNAYGIMTADTDTDGREEPTVDDTLITEEQAITLKDMAAEIAGFDKAREQRFFAWVAKLSGEDVSTFRFIPARVHDQVFREIDRGRREG